MVGVSEATLAEVEIEGRHKHDNLEKAYENSTWMHGRSARLMRVMAELMEPHDRLTRAGICCTMVVFGSARWHCTAAWTKLREKESMFEAVLKGEAKLPDTAAWKRAFGEIEAAGLKGVAERVADLESRRRHCAIADEVQELSRLLSEWVQSAAGRQAVRGVLESMNTPSMLGCASHWRQEVARLTETGSCCAVCTGGGPGLMEAANRGAQQGGGRSVGFGMELRAESGLNPFIDPGMAVSCHYFFTRKYWLLYPMIALVVAPGGFGTLDEVFEALTLKARGKLGKDFPIVLLKKAWWARLVNWPMLVSEGMILQSTLDDILWAETPAEAFEIITKRLSGIGEHPELVKHISKM